MRKKLFLFILLAVFFLLVKPASIYAQGVPQFDCDFKITNVNPPDTEESPGNLNKEWKSFDFSFDLGKITDAQWRRVPSNILDELRLVRDDTNILGAGIQCGENIEVFPNVSKSQKIEYHHFDNNTDYSGNLLCGRWVGGKHTIHVYTKGNLELCKPGEYTINDKETANIEINPVDKNGIPAPPDVDAYWKVDITNVTRTDWRHWTYDIDLDKSRLSQLDGRIFKSTEWKVIQTYGAELHFILNPLSIYDEKQLSQSHLITVNNSGGVFSAGPPLDRYIIFGKTFTVYPRGQDPDTICKTSDAQTAKKNNDCSSPYRICDWCTTKDTSKSTDQKRPKLNIDVPKLKQLCEQLDPNFQDACKRCVNSPKDTPPGKGGIWSAIGCLPTDFNTLIKDYIFKTGVGLAGGIAFIYFLYGVFIILTSSGNAEKMEEAKQIITSSLAGLLLIIFSIFLLQVIGVQILQLPGFK